MGEQEEKETYRSQGVEKRANSTWEHRLDHIHVYLKKEIYSPQTDLLRKIAFKKNSEGQRLCELWE
jgi:hypothetical protein